MKKTILGITSIIILSAIPLSGQILQTKSDSLSYSIGVVVAQNIKTEGFRELDASLMARAIQDVLLGMDLIINEAMSDSLFRAVLMEKRLKEKEMNKIAGETFLEENAKREGVTTLPSGLQYEIMVKGDGPSPDINDKVTTHYHGVLIDGTVFDSSVDRNEPITFSLTGVIKAWQEALPLMKVGSKWKIYSPYQLAYGDRAASPVIKPYSALIFEIELLAIE